MQTATDDKNWSLSGSQKIGGSEKSGAVERHAAASGTPNVIIGPGCRLNGTIELEGESEIHGTIEGEIRSTGELVIGEKAVLQALLKGTVIKIFGRVDGDIHCSERLELHPGAVVTGNIFSPSLMIREGVIFDGRCSMRSLGQEQRCATVLELRPSQIQAEEVSSVVEKSA